MGYYTRYELSVEAPNYNDSEIIEKFREECEYAGHALEKNGNCSDECKWYDHEKDLKAFSKKHPDCLFKLHGEGEESGDIWYKYFKNGKMQVARARILYDEYDPAKLE